MSLLSTAVVLGSIELHNRLVMPPMATSKALEDGTVSPAVTNYYAEKSQGGHIGLILIEHSFIDPLGKASANQLSVAEDRMVDGLKELASIIQANGSKTMMQINHAGSMTTEEITHAKPLAPSPIANPRRGSEPQEMTRTDIVKVIEAFQKAATRVKAAGFDGVEIHSAHGYLLNQFYSPLTNKRPDEYGGNLKNRIRLHLEVIEAVKGAVGPDFPILMRLGASDFSEGGITIEDSKEAAKYFEAAGINALDISGGFSGYNVPGLTEQGFFAPLSVAIKTQVNIPVILTGGVTDPLAAERLLAGNKADCIGVGRAILNDSTWAGKAMEILNQQ